MNSLNLLLYTKPCIVQCFVFCYFLIFISKHFNEKYSISKIFRFTSFVYKPQLCNNNFDMNNLCHSKALQKFLVF